MRRQLLLLAPSLVLFTCGIAIAHQDQDKPAEQVFKNIQSFKGEPASSILPAMQFISASLNVDCDFCHVEDKSSDEKREKVTARKMISMTKAINADNFGGRMQVTCATCHAGRPNPLSFPPVEGADLRARRAEGFDASKVLAAYNAAVGQGASVQSLQLEGESTRDGKSVAFTSVQSGPKVEAADGNMTIGYNGTNGWIKRPDGTYPIPPEVRDSVFRTTHVYFGSASLPQLDNPRAGAAKVDGKDVIVLSGTITGSKDRASLYFDKNSGLLARVEFLRSTILGYIPQIVSYSNYRKVKGVQVPMKISVRTEGDNEDRTIRSARINGTVDSSVFEQPKS